MKLFCSTFLDKCELVFALYDSDADGLISKQDIIAVLSHLQGGSNGSMLGKLTPISYESRL